MRSLAIESIPNGTKFVAIYEDGSGAELFRIDSKGELFNEGGESLGNAPD